MPEKETFVKLYL